MVPRASTVTRLVSLEIYFLKLLSLEHLQLPGWFPWRFIFLSYGPQGVGIYQVGFPGDLFSKVIVPRASIFIWLVSLEISRASTVTRLVFLEIYFLKLWSLGRLQLPGWFPQIFIFLSYGP